MTPLRVLVLTTGHAALAGYLALMAQQWLSVSSGRADLATLFAPSSGLPGQAWAAAIGGGILGPVLHVVLSRLTTVKKPRLVAMAAGVGYALAVMLVTILIWTPWMMVSGRGPGESVASALLNAAFVMLFGTPLLMITSALLFAPVIALGGAAIGIAAMTLERRARLT